MPVEQSKYPLIINIQKRTLTSLSTLNPASQTPSNPKPSKPESWAQKRVHYVRQLVLKLSAPLKHPTVSQEHCFPNSNQSEHC